MKPAGFLKSIRAFDRSQRVPAIATSTNDSRKRSKSYRKPNARCCRSIQNSVPNDQPLLPKLIAVLPFNSFYSPCYSNPGQSGGGTQKSKCHMPPFGRGSIKDWSFVDSQPLQVSISPPFKDLVAALFD